MAFIDKYRNYYLRSRFIFLIDLFLSVLSSYIILLTLRLLYSGAVPMGTVGLYLLTSLAATGGMMLLKSTAKIVIRHLSVRDLIPFATVSIGKGVILMIVIALTKRMGVWMATAIIVDVLFTFVLFLGVRLLMIVVFDYSNRKIREQVKQQHILVYDNSDKSVAAVVRLQNSEHYKVEGFLHRSSKPDSKVLEGLPIFNFDSRERLERIFGDHNVSAVLFSRDIDAQKEESGLIADCKALGIRTLIVPSLDEFVEGKSLFRPRDVKVEDLLGRDEIIISLDEIKANFAGKVVMVTGAAGSIGSELVRQLASFGVKKLILFDNAETPMHNLRLELDDKFKGLDYVPVIGDVRQLNRLEYAFGLYHPQVVFHAAAYKHVPLMEENPCEAVLVNVYGSRNVADMCLKYGVEKMVMISTDKAVNPTNIMGCTKRLAEIYVQSLGLAVEKGEKQGSTKFVTTRFGNVLGSNGSVIPRFRQQIANGGPVTVTHPDINRFFMTIPEACRLVMEAATKSTGNQIFVFDMGKPVKIDTLARRMIVLEGLVPDKDIKIEYSGLRPGEKLYEEVLSDKETTLPAFHDRIRIAKVREYSYGEADKVTQTLADLSSQIMIDDMVRLMKKTVPEFKSDNSRFSAIDAELDALAAAGEDADIDAQ